MRQLTTTRLLNKFRIAQLIAIFFIPFHLCAQIQDDSIKMIVKPVNASMAIGTSPTISVEIANKSSEPIYLDISELRIISSVAYEDQRGEISAVRALGIPLSGSGNRLHIMRNLSNLIGLPPGNKLIKLIAAPELKKTTVIKFTVTAELMVSKTPGIEKEGWEEIEVTSEWIKKP